MLVSNTSNLFKQIFWVFKLFIKQEKLLFIGYILICQQNRYSILTVCNFKYTSNRESAKRDIIVAFEAFTQNICSATYKELTLHYD